MAYIVPFKRNSDLFDGLFLTDTQNGFTLHCKVKTLKYETLVILPEEKAVSEGEIVCTYIDENCEITKIFTNLINNLKSKDGVFVINDKLTIDEINQCFSTKKLKIISGLNSYETALLRNEHFVEMKLIALNLEK